ncbi:LOW QUALITY PROTEIN: hypothetical protein NC652_015218 [Populus alba x Populus x berolinensis]|nr:LOW QUALITY PROTEIN: hypothetical protein NC652_015218 [Populus alba x Populus x berolinensis]
MAFSCLVCLFLGFLSKSLLVTAQLDDQAILLAINRELGVPGWGANNTNYCKWAGISCGLNHSMVEGLDLSRLGLRGGVIPDNLGSVSELKVLNLHSNMLEGPIPKSIFLWGILILTLNRLQGELPESVGNCRGLSNIRIGNNDLVGVIPKAIGNLVNLQELILSGNSLFGDIPISIIGCKSLNKLDLSNNRFNGTVPNDICNMSRLQYLLLGQNSIIGEIPHEIGNCLKLLELQMGSNYLTGNIPPEIGHIKNLQIALNLSFNHLHGPLPPELGKLDKLVSLDVSNNRLSGTIPPSFKGMLSLIEINFSNNLLSGPVPIFVPFQKSPNSSFFGNKGLCGEPLSLSCGNSYPRENYHHKDYTSCYRSGLAVFVSVTIVVLLFMMRERQEKAAKTAGIADEKTNDQPAIIAGNVFVENLKQAIDLDAVVKATLKDSNKLSIGTFSTVYKAVMPSGMVLMARRLKSMDRTIIHHQNKMIRELERLSKLCHDNLVRPVGFVIYEDVVLLLHHYLPNGTLAQLLHESSKKSEYEPDWPMRLSIAIGVAEGLAFLHHVATIHLDISSFNTRLPALGWGGGEIEALGSIQRHSKHQCSCRVIWLHSPEYAYTMQVTAPGNVYSYGVVLLEILTTRLPVDEDFGEGFGEVGSWCSCKGETPEQILDARLSTVSFGWRREMLAALKVALLCTDSTPAKRPKMKKVVEMLQEIKQS